MATTLFTSFLPEVLPYVHDCPQIVALIAIRNAAIEFCERTGYWQVDLAAIDVVADIGTYTMVTPTDTRIVEELGVWYSSILLPPKSNDELTRLYRGMDWRVLVGAPAFYTSSMAAELRLVPAPVAALTGGISIRATLAPTRAAAGVDSMIYEKQLDTIARGARARLLSMPGQPAYDPVQASAQRTGFLAGCNDARIRANKAATRTSVSIEIPRYI